MRLTGLDSNDSHHRRKGEEVINKEDIKDQEPNDINKKTRRTSTMTSSIIYRILTCAISHISQIEPEDGRNFSFFAVFDRRMILESMRRS